MSDELIKRIDAWFKNIPSTNDTWHLLADCKAEIYALQAALDETKEASLGVIEEQKTKIERLERQLEATERSLEDTTADLNRLESMREYVPMTAHDWLALWKSSNEYNYALNIESEVVKRAGLIVKEKE